MSDPTNQRADGCSVFFTLLILVVLLGLFYSAQKFFEPESPSSVTEAIDQARISKVNIHREASAQFISSVDQYHRESNTTLESSMNKILSSYKAPLAVPGNQSK